MSETPYTKKRAHLAIIRDFAKNNISPSLAERKALLSQIQAIPGCEDYKLHNLNRWFAKRQNSLSARIDPLLSSKTIQQLHILTEAEPRPSPKVIDSWAELLSVPRDRILAWLQTQEQEHNHLPSPVSTSPEPLPQQGGSGMWECKNDAPDSPAMSYGSPSTKRGLAYDGSLSQMQLLHGVLEAATITLNTKAPTNTAEFEEMFKPYEEKMKLIINKNEEFLEQHKSSVSCG